MKTIAKPTKNGIKFEGDLKLTYKVDGCDESYPIDAFMVKIEFTGNVDDVCLMLKKLINEKCHINQNFPE